MKLSVEVLDGSDLMPKDGQGSANPFVEIEFDGQKQKTQTKFKDLNPFWNQTFIFEVPDPLTILNRTIDVNVYHDRNYGEKKQFSGDGKHRIFLGRVRISGVSIAPSADAAAVQRFPLDKRGIFSRVRGDIALLLYVVADAGVQETPVKTEEKQSKNFPAPETSQEETRTFFSVPTAGGNAAEFANMRQPAMSGAGAPAASNVKAFFAQPGPSTVVKILPGAPSKSPEYGLIETSPPLASRLGYRGRDKISSTYDLVEQMKFLYVSVVKARDLPHMDITGSLDPYVEVKIGNYKGVTKHLDKNQNPIWRQVFAFSNSRLQSNLVEVVVKDKDFVKDDFVGRVLFDLTDVPLRVPPDSPLAPQWYKLADKNGDKLRHGEIMLAVWMGTQADEAFPDAWHSDAHSVGIEGLVNSRSKVYFSPRLMYLKVNVIEAQDLVPHDKSRPPNISVKVQLGFQVRKTNSVSGTVNPIWNQELIFVASEPFEEPLVIAVEDRVAPNKDENIGWFMLPVNSIFRRNDHNKLVDSRWFNLAKPSATMGEATGEDKKKEHKFASKIHLRLYLDMGYHVLDESTHYSSDLQPASRQLRKSRIGLLELGILSARNLIPMKAKEGRTTDAYCVAKYGSKWVRTRTLLDTLAPQWNEQYTWEVFDPCTVLTVAVFDNGHVTGHKEGARDQRIGKVRIRLSTLEADRVYTHFYPLLALQPSGLKKTGELHLAIRFTCTAWVNMVTLYGKPLLPKMHYSNPIPVLLMDALRYQAMVIVATRLGRAEPPLRREVVEYMLDVDSHMFSLRKSKANFHRVMSLLSSIGAIGNWFHGVRTWKNPVTTILVHVLFLILICYPDLILPTIFLYLFMIGILNYRYRPRHPPHMDTKLSHAELTNPDELDEEFDQFPTTKPGDIVRFRYDRLRSVAGRVQTVVGDLATQGERAHAILSWRDPRATAIFIMLALIVAIVLYVTPFQVIALIIGLYLLRHPKFRSKMPSVPYNFYRRLPAKSDMLL